MSTPIDWKQFKIIDDLVPEMKLGVPSNTQTATEVRAAQTVTEAILKKFAKQIDAEIFKLMTGGSIPPTQYDMLFAATVVCIDCGQPYLKRAPRDLLDTHCSSCEDAQKEAAGLK